MKTVMKYNVYKSISTLLTVGSPIITLSLCSDFFIHRSSTAISAAGMFSILISLLFLKDKIAENFKMPSALVLSITTFVLASMIENLVLPVKVVSLVTMITSGIDEFTFKRLYKNMDILLPDNVKSQKKFGFIFGTSDKLGV